MRRKDREITREDNIRKILDLSPYIHIAYQGKARIEIVPLCFGYTIKDNNISLYIHSAKSGNKVEAFRRKERVTIEASYLDNITDGGDFACRWSCKYSSFIATAIPVEIENREEKKLAFSLIFDKFTDKHLSFEDSKLNATAIFRFDVIDYSAKSNDISE